MAHASGERVIVDIGRWLVDSGVRQRAQPLKLPGKVFAVASAPDWTYSVLLDIPVTLDGVRSASLKVSEKTSSQPSPRLPRPRVLHTFPSFVSAQHARRAC